MLNGNGARRPRLLGRAVGATVRGASAKRVGRLSARVRPVAAHRGGARRTRICEAPCDRRIWQRAAR
ncbi:hypothetical protein C9I57_08535 [Trinickia symbiotica]|uniref:Uncharacterized protein n=1 Tax=Trinickia symbiotica TaxID=863227 RepID=A0A2T3XWC3_9BURK|nr:hypothetical protein C9I57_08535 [Trinickia symbiotica]